MSGFFIGLAGVALFFLCGFIVLIVLMQRASSNSGLGSAMGGGAAENVLGAESGNVLTRWTIYAAVAFFVICFGLYLFNMYVYTHVEQPENLLPGLVSEVEENGYVPGALTNVVEDEAAADE